MFSNNCEICNKEPFKYTCPRCNITYCSLGCYKSQQHLKCSEEFYKQCVQDELASTMGSRGGGGATSNEDMRKIYDILKRIRESDAGINTEDFDDDGLDESIGTDDEDNEDQQDEVRGLRNDLEECEDEVDMAERLKGIDINDAEKVWECLTSDEKEDFQKLVESGDIFKLMPDYEPWWLKKTNSKIVEMPSKDEQQPQLGKPVIAENIPKFSIICSKGPAPCIHYNLWNILAAYSCTVRFFNGEHLTNPNEATAYLINLSSSLKYGTNFEEVNDAIISVEMEALTTGNGASQLMPINGTPKSLLVESRTQLQTDARQLMSSLQNKLLALSDILKLLQLTKKVLKKPSKDEAEFQKLFALSSGMEELTRSKVQQLIKKLEFYLSYVNRDSENILI